MNKQQTLTVTLVLCLIIGVLASLSTVTATIYQIDACTPPPEGNGDIEFETSGYYSIIGQHFQMGANRYLTGFNVYAKKLNTPTGTLIAKLYNYSTKAVIAEGSTVDIAAQDTAYHWMNFTFPGTTLLQSGQIYFVGISVVSATWGTGKIIIDMDGQVAAPSSATGGAIYLHSATWGDDSLADLSSEIYGSDTDLTPTPTPTATPTPSGVVYLHPQHIPRIFQSVAACRLHKPRALGVAGCPIIIVGVHLRYRKIRVHFYCGVVAVEHSEVVNYFCAHAVPSLRVSHHIIKML